jgi:hypothetical protein
MSTQWLVSSQVLVQNYKTLPLVHTTLAHGLYRASVQRFSPTIDQFYSLRWINGSPYSRPVHKVHEQVKVRTYGTCLRNMPQPQTSTTNTQAQAQAQAQVLNQIAL